MKRKKVAVLTTAALTLTMTVCGSSSAIAASELTAESKPATQYTIDANQEVYALLDFEDTAEFENATKGLIASPDTLDICDENGKVIWSQGNCFGRRGTSRQCAGNCTGRDELLDWIEKCFVDG